MFRPTSIPAQATVNGDDPVELTIDYMHPE